MLLDELRQRRCESRSTCDNLGQHSDFGSQDYRYTYSFVVISFDITKEGQEISSVRILEVR